MKRAEIHKQKTKYSPSNHSLSTRFSKSSAITSGFFPFCHFIQTCFAIIILLAFLLFSSQNTFEKNELITQAVYQKLSLNIEFPAGEWSGTLKDILINRE